MRYGHSWVEHSSYRVESAGTEAKPKTIHPVISNRLIQKGTDPSAHVPQALTKAVIDRNDLIIAIGTWSPRVYPRNNSGRTFPSSMISFGKETPILDLHEALPDWET